MRWSLVALALLVACTPAARARVTPDARAPGPVDVIAELPDASADLVSGPDLALERRAPPTADARPDGTIDGTIAADLAPAFAADAGAGAAQDAGVLDAGTDGGPVWRAGQLVVAVGNDGQRMASINGKVWMGAMRDTNGNREGPKLLRAVAYANQRVVAVGGGCAPTCVGRILLFDGVDWRESDASLAKGRLTGVAYGNGAWIAVGSAPPILRSTDDGETWSAVSGGEVPDGLRAVTFGTVGGKAMFVAVGDGYTRASSTDGINWTSVPPGEALNESYRGVAIGNGIAVAVGGRTDGSSAGGHRVRSVDGVTWSDELVEGPDLPNVVFADGAFMAFSGAGDEQLFTSADGKTWSVHPTNGAGTNVATGLLDRQRFFVSRISPATIKISVDGFVWGSTAAMSMAGDAIINAFVIAGPPPPPPPPPRPHGG
jgi:photosystem II stability/assembly factor-like uncharacterized protein